MSWSSPHFFGVVASPEHGLFFWTPLVLLSLVGLALVAGGRTAHDRDRRWLATLFLLLFVLQVYISGAVESWTVAGSFGQRRFVAVTPLLVVGLSCLLALGRGSASRRLWMGAVALAVWWNVGLMAQFGLHLMDRQRLELRRNAMVTFVRLPTALPGIAWRYLTDRETFFDRPRQY
jgi:hypothetical protein